MERRTFMTLLAAGTLAALTGCEAHHSNASSATPGTGTPSDGEDLSSIGSLPSDGVGAATDLPSGAIAAAPGPTPSPYTAKLGSPPAFINSLPGTATDVALTIDDGVDSAVVAAYIDFITSANLRLTFFVNGLRDSWTEHAPALRKLVDSGQVQLGNHTWSHPNITTLSSAELVTELSRNEKFLNNTYGVTAKPFFRPPYGFHNARTDLVCADQGLSTITMWYGSFGDSAVLTQKQLLTLATQWLGAHRIVIGHANHPTVTTLYPQILELIRERHLNTITLDDAFYGSAGRKKTVAASASASGNPSDYPFDNETASPTSSPMS